MKRRFPPGYLAFVALEAPLGHKFLSLASKASILSIRKDLFLVFIYRPPFWAYINSTGNADPVATLGGRGRIGMVLDRGGSLC